MITYRLLDPKRWLTTTGQINTTLTDLLFVLQLSKGMISSWSLSTLNLWDIHLTVVSYTNILWTIWSGSRIWFFAIKVNWVPEDYLFCKLFKYSLAGDTFHWLKQLPSGSLTSWIDVKNEFLRNLFDEVRAEELRSKIATFTHEPMKSFRRTWMRDALRSLF